MLRPSHPTRRLTARLALAAAGVIAVATGACRREEISSYRVPKEAAGGLAASPAMAAADLPPPPQVEGGLQWKLPRGWSQSAGGQMRLATLKPPVEGRVDGSVVVLPGEAGGELANVNRWRGQIGLGPVDEAALAAQRKVVRTAAGPFALYDFTSEGQKRSRVVAALAVVDGNSWFLKLTGDEAPVTAARADFLRLVESVHR